MLIGRSPLNFCASLGIAMAQLSDKEKALIDQAQRDAGAGASTLRTDWDDSLLGAESAFPETVIGWDNPAADAPGGDRSSDKWAYIATMIEAERAEAQAARARTRRIVLSVTGVVVLILLAAGLQAFLG